MALLARMGPCSHAPCGQQPVLPRLPSARPVLQGMGSSASRRMHVTCMAHPRRVAKVTSQVLRELGDMFCTDSVLMSAVSPGRGSDLSAVASITNVYVSNDLQVIKAYVSIYSDARGRVRAMENLKRTEPYVRHEIGQRMRLRLTPEVHFEYDDSLEEEALVERVLGEEEVARIRAEIEAEDRAAYRASGGDFMDDDDEDEEGEEGEEEEAEDEDADARSSSIEYREYDKSGSLKYLGIREVGDNAPTKSADSSTRPVPESSSTTSGSARRKAAKADLIASAAAYAAGGGAAKSKPAGATAAAAGSPRTGGPKPAVKRRSPPADMPGGPFDFMFDFRPVAGKEGDRAPLSRSSRSLQLPSDVLIRTVAPPAAATAAAAAAAGTEAPKQEE